MYLLTQVDCIFNDFKAVFISYLQQGFRIQTVHAYGEFRALKDLIQNMPAGPRVNLTSANKHVIEIERHICVVKERSLAFLPSLPFNWIPKLIETRNFFGAQSLFYSHRRITGLQETFDSINQDSTAKCKRTRYQGTVINPELREPSV